MQIDYTGRAPDMSLERCRVSLQSVNDARLQCLSIIGVRRGRVPRGNEAGWVRKGNLQPLPTVLAN